MLNHSKSMAELQRWGKKMQNARSRTPALSDSARKDTPCEPIAISTPRLRLTHKFSSYFLSQTSPSKIADLETLLPSRMSNDTAQSVSVESTYTSSSTPPRPIRDAERCIDMLNAVFLEAPWQSIDAKHVGTLLSIFEAYRMLRAENDTLVERLEIVTRQYSSLEQLQQKAYEEWHTERAACKQEIKRLELVISKGERGLAGVTEARQGSLLRRGPKARREQHEEMEKETVFEFLRASKKEDDMARDKEKGRDINVEFVHMLTLELCSQTCLVDKRQMLALSQEARQSLARHRTVSAWCLERSIVRVSMQPPTCRTCRPPSAPAAIFFRTRSPTETRRK